MASESFKKQLSSYAKYSSADRSFEAPRLTLTFQVRPRYDLDYKPWDEICFVITRAADDPQKQTCIIHWDPIEDGFNSGDILLLRHEAGQLRPVPSNQPCTKSIHPRQVSVSNKCFKQLDPGDRVDWFKPTIPSTSFGFANGQSWEIVWKGGQIPLWDWGTLAEHDGSQIVPKSPAIILPSRPPQSFEFTDEESDIEDETVLYPSSPIPLSPSARVIDAPVLSMSIAGPETLSMTDRVRGRIHYPVTITITYDPAPGPPDDRPVIFHVCVFTSIDRYTGGFKLYFKDSGEWIPYQVNPIFMHHAYRFSKPEPFNVGQNDGDQFQALRPGESWSFTREVTDFPKNAAPGHQFRYRFKGTSPEWWDWGNFQDHDSTIVWLVEDRLSDPKDNDGRPAIVIPASNWVEFRLVE
ncbi:hypothetical protein N7508_004158 [Penicillium antarcticum]|uniref:uncharacterized protein n=1 Tax=Penicillium antarcticum TaxID=416450 RepID=UPI00238EC62B|nr:uncharacterized protein N7508_004158 [Penicillium antarcticum]KAJ5308779.1 hypothetical protein N7508_004158 [Penicillium antarcticum]